MLTSVCDQAPCTTAKGMCLEGGHASSAMMKVRKRSPRAAGLRMFLCEHVVLSVAVHLVTKDKLIRTIQTRHLQ